MAGLGFWSKIASLEAVIVFDYRTSEKQFQTEITLESDDPRINPLYATRELDV